MRWIHGEWKIQVNKDGFVAQEPRSNYKTGSLKQEISMLRITFKQVAPHARVYRRLFPQPEITTIIIIFNGVSGVRNLMILLNGTMFIPKIEVKI